MAFALIQIENCEVSIRITEEVHKILIKSATYKY